MWSDNETTQDLLGYQVHTDLLRKIILNDAMLPISIGAFGNWESGKSSLMLLLQQSLQEWEKAQQNEQHKQNMHKDSFDFVYNAEGDYYDLVVDKKIQKVVEELKALSHDVLIRYLTYWLEAIDSRKYVVESDLLHEEWYTDCCDYAASDTDEERYMHAKCMPGAKGGVAHGRGDRAERDI